MTSLVIVESPAKARTISRFLGDKYIVEASFGHIRDLPERADDIPKEVKGEKWARFGVNTEDRFQPVYVVPKSKQKQVSSLRKALKGVDELLLATDEDREGESIGWHLIEVLKPKVPIRRIVFHEITRDAIQNALENPRDLDMDLVHAQEGRRIIDRLFGYKLSPVLWKKVQSGLSAGRVQSVAVRLTVEREEERRAFVTSVYWDLEANIGSTAGEFKATLQRIGDKRVASGKDFDASTGKLKSKSAVLLTESDAANLLSTIQGNLPWKVAKVEEKPATQNPAPPFTTSTLQQEANRKLGYGARRTMQIAQRLYEGIDIGEGERVGLITYMRTDSVTLSEKALGDSQKVIRDLYGDDYAKGPRQYKTKTRNAQEAHEAIRPTEVSRRPKDVRKYLESDELKVYELIWKKTLASQMPPAKLLRTSVEIAAQTDNGSDAIFTASGKKIMFPGFLRAYVEGSDDPAAEIGDKEVILPDLKEGQPVEAKTSKADLRLLELLEKRHETSPPARYTEASLVKKLEEEGVGRPSTYASIIGTIQDRGYVRLEKNRQLVPTFVAMVVTDLLREHFPEHVDLKFTARMEEDLDQIASGSSSWEKQVETFYRGAGGKPGLENLVETKQENIEYPALLLGKDPDTGEDIKVKVGRYGPYLLRGENGSGIKADVPKDVAPAELTIEVARKLFAKAEEGPRNLGADPETGMDIYVMTGRYGDYVQLGETPEDKKAPKPKRASLEKDMGYDTVTIEQALKLLSLPRELGKHPESGDPILANNGRYGPYVQHQRDFRSLTKDDNVYTVTYERAMELISQPKATRGRAASKKVLKELGEDDGKNIQVLEGRYGPYVSDGKTNATLPKGTEPESVSMEQAKELIAAKAGSKRKTTKKAKKPAAKKPAAKKRATKK